MSRLRAVLICNSYRDRQPGQTLRPIPDTLNDGDLVKAWLCKQLDIRQEMGKPDKANSIVMKRDSCAEDMITEIRSLGTKLKRIGEEGKEKPLV
jgi:hypothetical protein